MPSGAAYIRRQTLILGSTSMGWMCAPPPRSHPLGFWNLPRRRCTQSHQLTDMLQHSNPHSLGFCPSAMLEACCNMLATDIAQPAAGGAACEQAGSQPAAQPPTATAGYCTCPGSSGLLRSRANTCNVNYLNLDCSEALYTACAYPAPSLPLPRHHCPSMWPLSCRMDAISGVTGCTCHVDVHRHMSPTASPPGGTSTSSHCPCALSSCSPPSPACQLLPGR